MKPKACLMSPASSAFQRALARCSTACSGLAGVGAAQPVKATMAATAAARHMPGRAARAGWVLCAGGVAWICAPRSASMCVPGAAWVGVARAASVCVARAAPGKSVIGSTPWFIGFSVLHGGLQGWGLLQADKAFHPVAQFFADLANVDVGAHHSRRDDHQ